MGIAELIYTIGWNDILYGSNNFRQGQELTEHTIVCHLHLLADMPFAVMLNTIRTFRIGG